MPARPTTCRGSAKRKARVDLGRPRSVWPQQLRAPRSRAPYARLVRLQAIMRWRDAAAACLLLLARLAVADASVQSERTADAMTLRMLSSEPRIYLVNNVMTPEEIDVYTALAAPMMERSELQFKSNASEEEVRAEESTRTSDGAYLGWELDPTGMIRRVEQRIATLVGIPRANSEDWNGE